MNVGLLIAALLAQAGPHFGKTDDVRPFEPGRRLAVAYYYAWFDGETGRHTDSLRDHPPSLKDFSGRSARWHQEQLAEIHKAGLDAAIVHYGGDTATVAALAAALDAMEKDLKIPPRVGVLLDAGTEDLAAAARDFYSLVPPRHWALVEGRPIVWLPPVAKPRPLEPLRAAFDEATGRRVFVVSDLSWGDVAAEARYLWGAARTGPVEMSDVVSVGPGFVDSAAPARSRDRDGGLFYEKSWCVALRIKPRIVAVETWNDFEQATEVCESREHGRKFLEITAKAVDKFHRGDTLPNPRGLCTDARHVIWHAERDPDRRGLRAIPADDGRFDLVSIGKLDALSTKPPASGSMRHVYFDVDDSFAFWERRSFLLEIEFLDQGAGAFAVEYDSADPTLSLASRPYRPAGTQKFAGTGEWQVAAFQIREALFGNRQAPGADFRIVIDNRGLMIRRVTLRPR